MRAPVTESYPGKAEEGLGSKAGGLGGREELGEERRDRAGREDEQGWLAEKGTEGKKGKSRKKQY